MSPFTALPSEAIVNILLFLPPIGIRRCRLVCHNLFAIIQDSPHLQYLLELDYSGYVTPLNPLNDLSFSEKIHILRKKRLTIGACRSTDVQPVDLGIIEPQGANCQFSRGVFALERPTPDVPRRIDLYQPASLNTNTGPWRHFLTDLGAIDDFRIDPDFDLLVLLETIHTPANSEADLQMRFHIRSLRTGLNHPLASFPTIAGNFKFTSTYSASGFQIVGQLLVILCYTNSLLDPSSPHISVWDWTTGDLVTTTEVPGRTFAFISKDTFIIPYDRRKWSGFDIIGSLEVFTLTGILPGNPAHHVASLHLPPTPDGPCHSASSFVFTPPPPTSLHIHGSPISTTPARIFEIGINSYYLFLHVRAFNIKSAPTEMAHGMLFMPSAKILQVLKFKLAADPRSRIHIPWKDWAHGTSWINNRGLRGRANCIFGYHAAFLDFSHKENVWKALIYDLRTNSRQDPEELQREQSYNVQESDGYLNAIFTDHVWGARDPSMVASFAISQGIDSWEEQAEDNGPDLMINDEHVLIFKEGSASKSSSLHVYAL